MQSERQGMHVRLCGFCSLVMTACLQHLAEVIFMSMLAFASLRESVSANSFQDHARSTRATLLSQSDLLLFHDALESIKVNVFTC